MNGPDGHDVPMTAQDWNELWRAKQAVHQLDHDARFWNERAKTFTNKDAPGSYTERFLALADVRPGESVMDMGCGAGNLAIPLAREGCSVLAADFSTAMLERVRDRAAAEGVPGVRTMELSWEDDWRAAGIGPDSFDVCLASRSIATRDLRGALLKLDATAKRRACITLSCDSSPRIDDRALRAIGFTVHPGYDDVYALAILQGEGIFPEVTYIKTERADVFGSLDEVLAKYAKMIDAALPLQDDAASREGAIARMRDWLRANLVEGVGADGAPTFTLKEPRHTMWAFLSWDKPMSQ